MLPDKDYLEAWTQSQLTPMLRQIAGKVSQNVNWITRKSYLAAVRALILDFHEKVPTAPYVIVLAESEINFYEKGCDYWLYQKLQALNLRVSEAVLSRTELNKYLNLRSDLKHVLLIDDVALSPNAQKKYLMQLHELVDRTDFTLHIGIPFISTAVAEFFLAQTSFPQISLLHHTRLQLVQDCLSDEEKEYIDAAQIDIFKECATLSYFEHHEGKYKSIHFSPLERGRNLLEGLNASVKLDDFCRMQHVTSVQNGLSEANEVAFDRFIQTPPRLTFFPHIEETQSEDRAINAVATASTAEVSSEERILSDNDSCRIM